MKIKKRETNMKEITIEQNNVKMKTKKENKNKYKTAEHVSLLKSALRVCAS